MVQQQVSNASGKTLPSFSFTPSSDHSQHEIITGVFAIILVSWHLQQFLHDGYSLFRNPLVKCISPFSLFQILSFSHTLFMVVELLLVFKCLSALRPHSSQCTICPWVKLRQNISTPKVFTGLSEFFWSSSQFDNILLIKRVLKMMTIGNTTTFILLLFGVKHWGY